MTKRITTLEEYYKKFPYPLDILISQQEARERNKTYLEELNSSNPWLAKNIYNKTFDDLPPNWKLVNASEMHSNVLLNCTEKHNRRSYYEHTPTKYRTSARPPLDMPVPIKIGEWLYAKDLTSNKMKYFNPYKKLCLPKLPPGWTMSFDDGDPEFVHTTGLIITFVPFKDMKVKKLNNNWYYYKAPNSGKNVYYNMATGFEENTKPHDA